MTSHINVKDFGASADGVTDDYPAIRAAIDNAISYLSPTYPSSPRIYFPSGDYFCSETIDLKHSVHLYGDDSGMAYSSRTRLTFPKDKIGIIVNTRNTFGMDDGPATTGADSTVVDGLQLWSSKTNPDASEFIAAGGETSVPAPYTPVFEAVYKNGKLLERGTDYMATDGLSITDLAPLAPGDLIRVVAFAPPAIWLRGRALLRNVYIRQWLGNGVQVMANATQPGIGRGNANCFRIEGGRYENCDKHGLFVDGTDANAANIIGLDVSFNKGWGIFDSSFLGNTYIGAHAQANGLGAYKADNANNRNIFLGCYSESGQPGSIMRGKAMVLGGLHGAGFQEGGQVFANNGGSLAADSIATDDGAVKVKVGGDPNVNLCLWMSVAGDPVPVQYKWRDGNMQLMRGNGSTGALEITGTNTGRTWGRNAKQPGSLHFPGGFALGNGNTTSHHNAGHAPPTSGSHGRGAIVWNEAPAPGGFVGWACVASGTPGTWKGFGLIEP